MKKLKAGFILVEVLFSIGVLAFVVVGILQLFIYCSGLTEIARLTTFAVSEAQGKLAEIRNHNFNNIVADYGPGGPENTFNLTQLTGTGAIYIDNTNPQLLEIEIVLSWQTKGGRIIGEDTNLNGAFDVGEDAIGTPNGKLDSPTSLISLIALR